jgi:hypothetical protein
VSGCGGIFAARGEHAFPKAAGISPQLFPCGEIFDRLHLTLAASVGVEQPVFKVASACVLVFLGRGQFKAILFAVRE